MSHIEFKSIFSRFKETFPPATEYNPDLTLILSTTQISEMFSELHPDIKIPDLYNYMVFEGYIYQPIEIDKTIKFYWLLDRL